jgi:hypothetical protein
MKATRGLAWLAALIIATSAVAEAKEPRFVTSWDQPHTHQEQEKPPEVPTSSISMPAASCAATSVRPSVPCDGFHGSDFDCDGSFFGFTV